MSKPDQIWFNGLIETLDVQKPFATAIAISQGRIIAVGNDEDVLNLKQSGTKIVNLYKKFLMPGLVESHTHALWGACKKLFDVSVDFNSSLDDLLGATKSRVAMASQDTVVIGGPWRIDMLENIDENPKNILDRLAPDTPVVLEDTTQHSLWCNTKVIELVGMENLSRDFKDGIAQKDNDGNLNGIFSEGACRPIRSKLKRTESQLKEASSHFVELFNQYGITSFKEPMADEDNLSAYKKFDETGQLTLHMAAHISKFSPLTSGEISFEKLEKLRRDYKSENIRTDFAKLFLDGVAPTFTASFFDPYTTKSGYDNDNHDPEKTLLMDFDNLSNVLGELDNRGFTTKIHAVGDYAIHTALNAIESTRKKNGFSGLRHEIAHCPFVIEDDIKRFKKLDIVAEVSPKLWFPNPMTKAQIHVLGHERVQKCHPIKSLLNSGASVTYASDWPAGTPDPNPWMGLAGMISRKDPNNNYDGYIGKDEVISLQQALPIFTINGAKSLGMEKETGTISIGKWADFIVLEKPIQNYSIQEIANMKVHQTIWKGRIVYSVD